MKNKKTKSKAQHRNMTPDLPQNIIPVGERVFEDKNIYIHQKVYEQIHKFSANKTENEHGGILVGRVLNEMGKENTIIEGFIEAKYNTATPTTLTFTHETWEYFHSEIGKRFKDKKIVGWIHTHPDFGIFLSENDKFIQQNFFTDANQVAYVVDPIRNDEGFFFWIDDKLERCPGFYLFDRNGAKIRNNPWQNEETIDAVSNKKSGGGYIFKVFTVLAMAILLLIIMKQSTEINKLKHEIDNMKNVINNQGMLFQQFFMPGVNETTPDTETDQNTENNSPRNNTVPDTETEQNNDNQVENGQTDNNRGGTL